MIFEAKTLEDVYTKASEYFGKSISELKIKIIQSPTNGVFGFFSKNAIIEIEDEETSISTNNLSNENSKEKNTIFDDVVVIEKEINDLFKLDVLILLILK